MEYSISTYILMGVLISLIGWIVENAWLALTRGYIDNRNMHLPFLFGYGVAAVALFLIVGTPSTMLLPFEVKKKETFVRLLIYFLLMVVLVSIGEIILGTVVEKTCHFYYWDYTVIPMHITRYTSIPTSMGFALIITTFMDKCFVPIMNHLAAIPAGRATFLAWALGVALTADFVISFLKMHKLHHGLKLWRRNLSRHSFQQSFQFNK